MSDFPNLSAETRRDALSQDLIPWTSFMEGKVSKEILALQRRTLLHSPSPLSIADWSKQLISRILHISHEAISVSIHTTDIKCNTNHKLLHSTLLRT